MRFKWKIALHVLACVQASAAMANPICAQPTSGTIGEIDQTYVKMQARNYSSATAKFELWLSPRVSGNTASCIDTANGWTKDGRKILVTNNPTCNTSNWGTASITLTNGERQSDGTTWYVGRMPLLLDELLNGVHTQYKLNYDFNLVLNADKTLNKFCVDVVQGTMDNGSSAYWPAMIYPSLG